MGCVVSALDQPPKKEEQKYSANNTAEQAHAAQAAPTAQQSQGQSSAPPAAAALSSAAVAPAPPAGSIVPGHAHPLLLWKARYGGDVGTVQYTCDLCGGEGEGASFSCESCCVDSHPRCFKKAGGSAVVLIPEHAAHALTFFESRYEGRYGCNMCTQVYTGEAWACEACGFDACPSCAMKGQKAGAPPAAAASPSPVQASTQSPDAGVSSISLHPHPLIVFAARYGDLPYTCDLCKTGSAEGEASFSCEECSFDAHPRCVKAAGGVVKIQSPDHQHELSWYVERYDGAFRCNICQTPGKGAVWACDACGFDAHEACTMKGQKIGVPPAAYLEAVAQQQQRQKAEQEAQAQAAAQAAARAAAEARINKPPTWPADNVAYPFPATPFSWNLGAEASKICAMEGPALKAGADFSLYASHFPAAFTQDPKSFWDGFKRVVLFDLRMLHLWATGPLIDEAMNAVVWAAIFAAASKAAAGGEGEKAWKDLASRGILCAPLESIPSEGNSIFVTHRWSKAGGICSMSPSFFTAYTLFNCGIKGKAPAWVWCDLLSVPQPVPTFSNPHNFSYSARESQLRLLCNAEYMAFVGLKFGAIALRCHYFLKHQPLVTIFENYKHPLTGEGGLNKYPLQRAYFAKFGMSEDFLQFDSSSSAEKAGMTLLDQIKVYTTGTMMNWNSLFYTDMSYVNRIWCIAEFAVRVSGRGQENFKDCVEFYARLWEQNAQDFKAHHDGPGVVRGLNLRAIKELKSDYVLHSLEGCRVDLNAPSTILHAKLMSSMMSFEGLCCIVADAAATQVRDVPLVISTLYGDLCNRLFAGNKADPPPIPAPMQAVLSWCIDCGVGAARVKPGEAGWVKMQQSFYALIDPASGVMKRYLEFTGAHMKQGANSLMLLERLLATLVINGKSLAYSAANDAVPSAPSAAKTAAAGTPKGFEFAPTACWYLHDVLGLRVSDLFLDGDTGTNQPWLADFGPRLAETEDFRFKPATPSSWKAPKSIFPGYPLSEHLFSVENLLGAAGGGVIDPLCNFQSLLAEFVCPYRPVYAIAARQSDVGWTGRLGWFEKELVYIQLTSAVRGVPLEQIKAWIAEMDRTTHPKAIRVFGSRTITATARKILWNPNNDGQKELH